MVRSDSATVLDAANEQVKREIAALGASAVAVEKVYYRHYMQKEISEQPTVVAQTLHSFLRQAENSIAPPQFDFDISSIRRVTILASSTSYYACTEGKYWLDQFARVPVDIDFPSEFRYRAAMLEEGQLELFISQCEETADTRAALRHGEQYGQIIATVVNAPTNSMAREADVLLPAHPGPKLGIASTKAFTC